MEESIKQNKKFTREDFISIVYYFIPLICNLVIVIVLFLIIEIPFSFFESDINSSIKFLIIITVVGLVVAIARNILNYFIPKKWEKFHHREIKILHWGIASIIYFILIVAGIFIIQAIFPYLKDMYLWSYASIIFISSFDIFLLIYGAFLLFGELSGISGVEAFVYVIAIYPLILTFFLPSVIFPNIFVYMGYHYGRKKLDEVEDSSKKLETEDEIEEMDKSELDMN
ncbi:MAG TPA: hypothetical protein VMX55_08425 [candidate division Zixibacteria bacterium]|nr:hypothetical protein [candidate division Zixibacteria bacterium]